MNILKLLADFFRHQGDLPRAGGYPSGDTPASQLPPPPPSVTEWEVQP